jgi:hypothetical protein
MAVYFRPRRTPLKILSSSMHYRRKDGLKVLQHDDIKIDNLLYDNGWLCYPFAEDRRL